MTWYIQTWPCSSSQEDGGLGMKFWAQGGAAFLLMSVELKASGDVRASEGDCGLINGFPHLERYKNSFLKICSFICFRF